MIATIPVCQVTVSDPDTQLPVELEIRKMETGTMIGLDACYLEQLDGTPETSFPMSPYDLVIDFDEIPEEAKDEPMAFIRQLAERQNHALALHIPDDELESVPSHDLSRKWFTVIGRIPGSDEDSCWVIAAESREAAVREFETEMYAHSHDTPEAVKAHYKKTIAIAHVLESATEPKIL